MESILSLYISSITLAACGLLFYGIGQGIIRHDLADLLSIGSMMFIPVFAAWGLAFGIVALVLVHEGRRRIAAVIGTSINACMLVGILLLWTKLVLFLSSFNGWID